MHFCNTFYTMKTKDISKRLTEFRKSQHITLRELSEKLQMEQQTLCSQLNGSRGVTIQTIKGIGRLFPMLNITWVMTGEGAMLLSDEVQEHLATRGEVEQLKKELQERDIKILCLEAQVEALTKALQRGGK